MSGDIFEGKIARITGVKEFKAGLFSFAFQLENESRWLNLNADSVAEINEKKANFKEGLIVKGTAHQNDKGFWKIEMIKELGQQKMKDFPVGPAPEKPKSAEPKNKNYDNNKLYDEVTTDLERCFTEVNEILKLRSEQNLKNLPESERNNFVRCLFEQIQMWKRSFHIDEQRS